MITQKLYVDFAGSQFVTWFYWCYCDQDLFDLGKMFEQWLKTTFATY